jgi:hypothetical protein
VRGADTGKCVIILRAHGLRHVTGDRVVQALRLLRNGVMELQGERGIPVLLFCTGKVNDCNGNGGDALNKGISWKKTGCVKSSKRDVYEMTRCALCMIIHSCSKYRKFALPNIIC